MEDSGQHVITVELAGGQASADRGVTMFPAGCQPGQDRLVKTALPG
jgi:hypothetical protein